MTIPAPTLCVYTSNHPMNHGPTVTGALVAAGMVNVVESVAVTVCEPWVWKSKELAPENTATPLTIETFPAGKNAAESLVVSLIESVTLTMCHVASQALTVTVVPVVPSAAMLTGVGEPT